MESRIAQLILQDQPITYALTDRKLRIIEIGGDLTLLGSAHSEWKHRPIWDLVPEFIGHEADIDAVLTGNSPRFELPLVNRNTESGQLIYTNLVTIPYVKRSLKISAQKTHREKISGILYIVENISAAAIAEQKMLQQRNELGLLRDELRQQNSKLRAANAELQQLDDLKSRFISIAAHELRNPITTISVYTHMLLHNHVASLTEQQLRNVQVIHRSTERLTKLTNNLMDSVMLDAGHIELLIKPTNLVALVEDSLDEWQPVLEDRQQHLLVTADAELPAALCDEDRTLQILGNLIYNASKYSPNGSEIRIHLALADPADYLQVSIIDPGIGIPAAEQSKLFSRFFRASNTHSANIPGSGLGLSIVRALVELHSGRIKVESETNVGTKVHVFFPVEMKDKAG